MNYIICTSAKTTKLFGAVESYQLKKSERDILDLLFE